jgi:hypothetical protein
MTLLDYGTVLHAIRLQFGICYNGLVTIEYN